MHAGRERELTNPAATIARVLFASMKSSEAPLYAAGERTTRGAFDSRYFPGGDRRGSGVQEALSRPLYFLERQFLRSSGGRAGRRTAQVLRQRREVNLE